VVYIVQLVTEGSQLSEVSIPDAEALEFSDTNEEFTTWPCNLVINKNFVRANFDCPTIKTRLN